MARSARAAGRRTIERLARAIVAHAVAGIAARSIRLGGVLGTGSSNPIALLGDVADPNRVPTRGALRLQRVAGANIDHSVALLCHVTDVSGVPTRGAQRGERASTNQVGYVARLAIAHVTVPKLATFSRILGARVDQSTDRFYERARRGKLARSSLALQPLGDFAWKHSRRHDVTMPALRCARSVEAFLSSFFFAVGRQL